MSASIRACSYIVDQDLVNALIAKTFKTHATEHGGENYQPVFPEQVRSEFMKRILDVKRKSLERRQAQLKSQKNCTIERYLRAHKFHIPSHYEKIKWEFNQMFMCRLCYRLVKQKQFLYIGCEVCKGEPDYPRNETELKETLEKEIEDEGYSTL